MGGGGSDRIGRGRRKRRKVQRKDGGTGSDEGYKLILHHSLYNQFSELVDCIDVGNVSPVNNVCMLCCVSGGRCSTDLVNWQLLSKLQVHLSITSKVKRLMYGKTLNDCPSGI